MEVPGGHKVKPLVCLYEALGTATLLIAINWSGGSPYAISIVVFAAIVVFGSVCGAHFNPAVTIAVLIKNGDLVKDLPFASLIILSQIIGGLIGVLTVFMSLSKLTDDAGVTTKTETLGLLCPTIAKKSFSDKSCDPENYVF